MDKETLSLLVDIRDKLAVPLAWPGNEKLYSRLKAEIEKVVPDRASIFYMRDNHTFIELTGRTIDEVVKKAHKVHLEEPYGMLCPVLLTRGDRHIREVGGCVNSHGTYTKEAIDYWENGLRSWKQALASDPDVAILLALRAET